MSDAAPLCEGCGRPMAMLKDWSCRWPKCDRSGVVTEEAEARIVIEWSRLTNVRVSWWRNDSVSAFSTLRLFKAMVDAAWGVMASAITSAISQKARLN